jgi:hypothetical protein
MRAKASGAQVRSAADAAIREQRDGVGEKCERAGPPVSRAQPAERAIRSKGRGAARDVSTEAAKAREPSRLRLAATKMPRERNGVTGAPHAQRTAGRIPAQPASGRCGAEPCLKREGEAQTRPGEKAFSPAAQILS